MSDFVQEMKEMSRVIREEESKKQNEEGHKQYIQRATMLLEDIKDNVRLQVYNNSCQLVVQNKGYVLRSYESATKIVSDFDYKLACMFCDLAEKEGYTVSKDVGAECGYNPQAYRVILRW